MSMLCTFEDVDIATVKSKLQVCLEIMYTNILNITSMPTAECSLPSLTGDDVGNRYHFTSR